VDPALAGRSKGTSWSQVRRDIEVAARGASPALGVIFDDEARDELLAAALAAALWYDEEREGLGFEVLDAVDALGPG
jgi:hypothetical protein